MKQYKLNILAVALCLLGLSACQNEDILGAGEQGTFEFYTSATIDTRTSLQDGKAVVWNEGDAVAVYDYATTKRKFVAEISDDIARFKGNITPKYGNFIAAYPYDLAAENDVNKKIIMRLPAEQTAVADGFGPNLNLSIAKGERNVDGSPSQVRFRNVCQLFKFGIPTYVANRIVKIELTANTPVAGQLSVDYTDYDPVVTVDENGPKTISLLAPAGAEAFAEGTYYFVMAPVELDGFTLTLTDKEGKTYTQQSSSSVGGICGFIYNLGNMDLVEKPLITSQHVYDNNVLVGTKVTLTAPVPDKPWSAEIKNESGETVRTLSETVGTLTTDYNDINTTWPYLPKGHYTVDYTYTTANGKQMNATSVFSVTEDPKFTVSLEAFSTYSYYMAGDVATANAKDKYSVSGIVCRAHGILPSLLADEKYGFQLNNNFSGSIASTGENQANYNDISISDLGEHELTASVTFDGVTQTARQKVRITGLPLRHEPPTSENWSANNGQTSFEDNHVKTGNAGSNGEFTCSKILVPAGTKMTLAYKVEVYMDNALSTQRYRISVGSDTPFDFSTGDSGTKNFNESKTFTSSDEARIIKCYTGYCYGRSNSKTYMIALSYSE